MSGLRIVIPGEPVAQGRSRVGVVTLKSGVTRGVIFDPKKSRNWKATAQEHMVSQAARRPPILGPVRLEVVAIFSCPASDFRKREPRPRRRHTKKPDADNVLKAVKDAAKGVLWRDDSQVCDVRITKWIGAQGGAPRVEIEVEEIQEAAAQVAPSTAEHDPGDDDELLLF